MSDGEFREIRRGESHYFIQGPKSVSNRTVHIYNPILVKFGFRDLHILLLNFCEFCENLPREGHTFLKDMYRETK